MTKELLMDKIKIIEIELRTSMLSKDDLIDIGSQLNHVNDVIMYRINREIFTKPSGENENESVSS